MSGTAACKRPLKGRVETRETAGELLVDDLPVGDLALPAHALRVPWMSAVGVKGDAFYVVRSPSHDSTIQPMKRHSKEMNQKDASHKGDKANVCTSPHVADNRKDTGYLEGNGIITGDSAGHNFTTRTLSLIVDPGQHNYGRRATYCEKLLGICPEPINLHQFGVNLPSAEKMIRVANLLHDGESIRSGVKIGDVLYAVNNTPVNFNNIDSVLACITSPKRVRLTLLTVVITQRPKPAISGIDSPVADVGSSVKLVSGNRLEHVPLSLENVPHGAMYLTMNVDSEKMADREDVIYCFPHMAGNLFEVRGAFVTLSQVIVDVTKSAAKSSTMLVGGDLVHIVYQRCDKEVFILCAPDNKLSIFQLNHVMRDIVRVIEMLFGSLKRTFTVSENHNDLNNLFALTFQQLLLATELINTGMKQSRFVEPFLSVLPGVRAVVIPEETKVLINDCLSDFEAADFGDMSEDYYGRRRSYIITGSCLFYKGYLLASHLPKEDLIDIKLYLSYQGLLTMCNEEQLGHLVVWKEIYPTRRHRQKPESVLVGFTEPNGRWFLLVVGMQNAVLATVLEAGGCASPAEGFPTPDPFYIDQALASLIQLDKADAFLHCRKRLEGPPMPSLSCADWFLPSRASFITRLLGSTVSPTLSTAKPKQITKSEPAVKLKDVRKTGSLANLHSSKTSLKKVLSWEHLSDDDCHSVFTTGDLQAFNSLARSNSVGSEDISPAAGGSRLFKGQKRYRNLLSMLDVSDLKKEINEEQCRSLVKVTSGCTNTLFHYIHFDDIEGIFICPAQQELLQVTGPLMDLVMANFHSTCLVIRDFFERQQNSHAGSHRQVRGGLGEAVEHGMLFTCSSPTWNDPKKSPPSITYWVVGRRLETNVGCREFYACFHETPQQNIVEVAFKLMQGVLI